jgi:hypothetical protein
MEKESRDAIRYGTRNGELKLGHVHNDQVLSAVMLRSGYDYRHYNTLDGEGKRAGWTTNRSPKVYQIKCGDDLKKGDVAFILDALNGDIVLRARNGDIRMHARNIDIKANENAHNNSQGFLTLEANEKIELRSKNVEVNGSSVVKFFSSGSCEIVSKASLNFSAGIMAMTDNFTSGGSSKPTRKPPKIEKETQAESGTLTL